MGMTSIHTDGRWFKDEYGRVTILRGVNVAGNSKVPPFSHLDDLCLLNPLVLWGLNVIRLVLVWEAIEPQPSVYNEAYIERIEQLAAAAGANDIYVILDMHQDMFSRFLNRGCGDGFPSWAIDPSIPRNEPANNDRCTDWFMGITDSNVIKAFDTFYANVNGIRDHYISMWVHLAGRLSRHQAVIGYDLINEPFGDEITQVAPLYEDIGAAIRQIDPDSILFIEPGILRNIGTSQSELPLLSLGNFVYAPHFYSPSMTIADTFNPEEAENAFALFQSKVNHLGGVPLFLGEFGMPPHKSRIADYINDIYRRLDHCLSSGAQWNYTPSWNPRDFDGWNMEDFSIVDDRGQMRRNFSPRAYPQSVSGLPVRLESTDNRLYFEWRNDPAISAPTVLHFPVDFMFGGAEYDLIESPRVTCNLDASRRRILCHTSGEGMRSVEVKRR